MTHDDTAANNPERRAGALARLTMTDAEMARRIEVAIHTMIRTDGNRDAQVARMSRIIAEQIRRGPSKLVEVAVHDLERVVGL